MTREEAIKVANEMYGWVKTDREREALETLVPELADSEDEKMRKFLLNYFKFRLSHSDMYINNTMWEGVKVSDIIAYLERQKEATNFAELMNKLSAKEQEAMFGAWPKEKEWTADDDRILYNVIAYVGYAAGQIGVKPELYKEANEWLKDLPNKFNSEKIENNVH